MDPKEITKKYGAKFSPINLTKTYGATFTPEVKSAPVASPTPEVDPLTGENLNRISVTGSIKNAYEGGINQSKEGYAQAREAATSGDLGGLFSGSLKLAAGGINTLFSPLAPVGDLINKTVVEPTANVLSEAPLIKEAAGNAVVNQQGQTEYVPNLEADRVVEDIANANTIVGGVAGAMDLAPKIKAAPTQIADVITSNLDTAKNKFLNPDKSFETSMNKAFPVLKKDVSNLSKKSQNIHAAFTDIIENKQSLGFLDKKGVPRNPETFTETVEAQNARLPKIYKNYTEKLQGADKVQFEKQIHQKIFDQITSIDEKLAVENLVDNRRALVKIKNELGSLRDTSPEGIQNYIQAINQKVKPSAPGGSLTPEQIQYANLAGDLRKVLDE